MDKLFKMMNNSAKLIQVIEIKTIRGNGTDGNPARLVTEYWTVDGEMLADDDRED